MPQICWKQKTLISEKHEPVGILKVLCYCKELFCLRLVGFRSLVEEKSTYWTLVNLLHLQNELVDIHQSHISKMLRYFLHAPPNGQVWHKAFFGGSGSRAVAHTRLAFPKNAYGPVGIPLIRGASGAGWSTPHEGGNSLGGGPMRPKEIIQLPRHTRPDLPCSQHGRPDCDPTTESAKCCSFPLQT